MNNSNSWLWIAGLVVGLVVAFICARVAGNKGHSAVGYGLLGFFLPLIGIIVVLVIKDRTGPKSIA